MPWTSGTTTMLLAMRWTMPDANKIISAYCEDYDRGADVAHQELRSWRPAQHGPECVCALCATARVLRDHGLREAIEIIATATARHRLKEREGVE